MRKFLTLIYRNGILAGPYKPETQSIMRNSAEEIEIIKTVLDYCGRDSTHMENEVLLNPVSHYTGIDRLRQEVDTLFREFPIILGHVEQVREPGQYFTHDDTGVPILVTKDRDGRIRSFVNVCRHRGARIVTEPCGTAKSFSCPYHAWTYDLQGKLRGMRQPNGFEGVDKDERGLVELPTFERFGLIWGRPKPTDKVIDIDKWLAPMAEQLGSLDLENHTVYKAWALERKMGWRIALEGFQESYHFCAAHKNTACSAYLDNQSVFVDQYPHFRHAVPLTKISELKDEPENQWDYRANFMTQNYLFPCNFVQVMTDHVYIHTICPTGNGQCVFKCLMLIPEVPQTEKAERHWEANYNVVRTVFNEDFEIGEGIQSGFAAGVNRDFVIGKYESGIQLAQKAMDDALEGRLCA